MSGVSVLPAIGLMVLAVFCVRAGGAATTRRLLLAQAVLLWLALLTEAPMPGSLVGAAFVCGEFAFLWMRAGCWRERSEAAGVWPIASALAAIWISFRLLPAESGTAMAPALGVVLAGTVALAFAPSDRSRWAALLSGNHGVLLLVALLPRSGWIAWPMVLLPQTLFLLRFCARSVWSDPVEADGA